MASFTTFPMTVGFTYTSQGQLVRPAVAAESGARSGPAIGKKRRSHYLIAQLEGTQGVSFGTQFTNAAGASGVVAALFKTDYDTNYTVLQQFSGVFRMNMTDPYSFDSMPCWQVTRPYICNITALGAAISTQDI